VGKLGQNVKIKITQVGGRFATADVGEETPQASDRVNLVIWRNFILLNFL